MFDLFNLWYSALSGQGLPAQPEPPSWTNLGTGGEDRLLTAKEVGRRLALRTRTLWRRVNAGQVPPPAVRGPGLRPLWRKSDIDRHIQNLANP